MKRLIAFFLLMTMAVACYDIHYQPVFENFPDEEYAVPYDRDIIPAVGDTCWFNYHLEKVMVKAFDIEPPVKDFKWEVLIDGKQYGETMRNNGDGLVFNREQWWKERTGLEFPIYQTFFEVPANPSAETRNIEVRASIDNSLVSLTEDWGEWFTVFEGTQAGREFSKEMMPGHSLDKSQVNIFEPVQINMHKCDDANNLSWYRQHGICDSLVWSVRGFDGSRIVMKTGKETIFFTHRFTLPGEYESVLSAYKGNKVIYEDVKDITVTNDKDFLMFDWEDVISGTAKGEAYLNVLNPDIEFASIVKCEDGNPQILIYVVPTDRLTPKDERQILYDYMCELYYVPAEAEEWITDTSVARLINIYNEFTESDEWRITAEPLRSQGDE